MKQTATEGDCRGPREHLEVGERQNKPRPSEEGEKIFYSLGKVAKILPPDGIGGGAATLVSRREDGDIVKTGATCKTFPSCKVLQRLAQSLLYSLA